MRLRPTDEARELPRPQLEAVRARVPQEPRRREEPAELTAVALQELAEDQQARAASNVRWPLVLAWTGDRARTAKMAHKGRKGSPAHQAHRARMVRRAPPVRRVSPARSVRWARRDRQDRQGRKDPQERRDHREQLVRQVRRETPDQPGHPEHQG
jgi:hypothetical protein